MCCITDENITLSILCYQLDVQGDLYENAKKELNHLKAKAEEYILQVNIHYLTPSS